MPFPFSEIAFSKGRMASCCFFKKTLFVFFLFSIFFLFSSKSSAQIIYQDDFDGYTSDFSLDTGNHVCPANGKYSNTKGCYGNAVAPALIGPAYDRVGGTDKRGFFQSIFDSWAEAGSDANDSTGNEEGLGLFFPSLTNVMYVRWYQKDTYTDYANFQKLFRISSGTLGNLGTPRIIPMWQRTANNAHVQMILSTQPDSTSHFFTGYNLDTDYTPGTWVCYEIKIDSVNKVGEFWVNGTSKGTVDLSGVWSTTYNFNSMQVGGNHSYKVGQSGNYIAYDDVVVSDSYNGLITEAPPDDSTPPTRSDKAPTGELASGTTQATLSLSTDENATCKFSTVSGTAYADMTNVFEGTSASHTYSLSGLSDGITYSYFVRCQDEALNPNSDDYNISFSIANPDPPSDATPPTRSAAAPSGELASGTTQATLSLTTSENATCKFSIAAGTAYASMSNAFSGAGTMSQTYALTGLTDGTNYSYFVRCQDEALNPNSDDYAISFSIESTPVDDDPVVIPTQIQESSDSSSHSSKSAPTKKKRKISVSPKKVAKGQTIVESGKRFSKSSDVSLSFSKYGGGYYAPKIIKTDSKGNFSVSYKIPFNKPSGSYSWYAVDLKTGKKSKNISFNVK